MSLIKFVLLVLALILGYAYIKLDSIVRKKYFNSGARKTGAYIYIFPIVLLYPFSFFKKKNLLKGYLLYLIGIICLFGAVYILIIKILGGTV